MRARSSVIAALALCLVVPALAQDTREPAPAAAEAPPATASYPVRQDMSQWLGSNLMGAKVVSVSKERVGRIVNLVMNDTGAAEAVIIAVGGLFGIGAKDVAVTYESLSITRTRKGDAIDHVTIAATRDDLLRASEFKSLKRQMAEAKRELTRVPDLRRGLQIDRDKLRDAAFRHGDAEQPVHARHRDRIMRDDDEARVGQPRH